MRAYKSFYCHLRILIGLAITAHGLLRIYDISEYSNFVLTSYYDMIPSENFLLIASIVFPFLEFFTGWLITLKIGIKRALEMGFFISLVMVFFILLGGTYERLLYHAAVLTGLSIIYLFVLQLPPHKRATKWS
ncbi:MAG: hypothetical protein AAFP76_16845 [Bacteroidota bacterium]